MRPTVRLLALLLLVLGVAAPAGTVAQGAPTNPFADLGLPEIAVTITESAIEGAPAELAAGRYVLAVTNGGEEDLGAGFLQAPDGMTAADLVGFLTGLAAPPASPAAEGGEGGGDAPPPWYFETRIAGGIYANPGQTAHSVLDLTAGEWILWAEDPAAPQAPVPVVVSGEAPADLAEPTADVTITGQEMSFTIDGALAAGPQTIAFTNAGQQPHFLLLLKVPDGTTVDDFLALSATFGDPSASPPAGLSFDQIEAFVNTADQSSGVTTWTAADLDAGSYVVVCFVPDPESGAPHAMLGMIDLVTVG